MKWGLSLLLLCAVPAGGEEAPYQLIEPGSRGSARDAAVQMLQHLAEGNIEAAAAMSNAPQQRREVLQSFRESIGEPEFKRLFGRYFASGNRLLAEVALGRRRLLVWDLGEAEKQLAGQYYIETDGKFLLDDVPGPERATLQRVLQAYRAKTQR